MNEFDGTNNAPVLNPDNNTEVDANEANAVNTVNANDATADVNTDSTKGAVAAGEGVDNGAHFNPNTQTGNPELDSLNARTLQLQQQRDQINDELNQLAADRDRLAVGQVWTGKLDTMSEAEVAALQEALANRQSVGTNGIPSRESVNGQTQPTDNQQ